MRATTTQLLSSGEFCRLRYDTIPVKSASANISFYTNNSKMHKFLSCWHSCWKWAIYGHTIHSEMPYQYANKPSSTTKAKFPFFGNINP